VNLVKKNIIANFIGSIWQALIGVAFVPLYIKFMGIESWGLISIFTTLHIIFGLLDMGLSSTLNREMARLSVIPQKEQEMRNLVRTLEILYWGIAILAGISIVSLSPFIAHHWIKSEQLPPSTIEQSFLIMGFIIIFQMLVGFYSGGLMGLQRHILLNGINVTLSTVRSAGAILILWLISPTIQAFFYWQIITSIIHSLFLGVFFWRKLPSGDHKPFFQKSLFKDIWRFTIGMSGIAVLSVILTQMDKIILSKILPFEMFGYYAFGSVIGMSLLRLIGPVFSSVYPKFTQLVSTGDQEELKRLYHNSCQFIAVLILPIATVVALFSYEILFLWTQNQTMAGKSYLLVSILICGTALNGLMHFPFALQLAYGWTKLSFFKNVIAVILLVPFITYMAVHYGAIGAASAWLILNFSYVIVEIPIMHRRLLPKEKWRWYWQDVFCPFAVCILTAGLGRLMIKGPISQVAMIVCLMIVSVITLSAAMITTPLTRGWLFGQLIKFKLIWKSEKKINIMKLIFYAGNE
jgi:O-antigen/teichoic acid export membrane protein